MSARRGEDLSARSRREHLTRAEQHELERNLQADPALALAHHLGSALDRETAARRDDQRLIERAVDGALSKAGVGASGFARGPRIAGVTTLCGGVVALMFAGYSMWSSSAAPRSAGPEPALPLVASEPVREVELPPAVAEAEANRQVMPAPPPSAAAPVRLRRPARAVKPVDSAAFEPAEQAVVAREHTQPSAAVAFASPRAEPEPAQPAAAASDEAATRPRPSASGLSAAELFRRANLARRAGDRISAQRDYMRLIDDFSDSSEAQLAQLALGKLLQAQGAAVDAERVYARYLAEGHGQLDEEALVNRAQTLRSLQRHDDERRIWRRLLSQFPASVYAGEAKRRLLALDSATRDGAR